MSKERHYYKQNGIPGGVRCKGCGGINTCVFYEGYWTPTADGGREYCETIECDCGARKSVTWAQQAPFPVGTEAT